MKLSEIINKPRRFKGIVKGESGVGKSIFACSFPKPMYVIDCDGRMGSVATYYKDQPEILDGIEYDSFQHFYKVEAKVKELCAYCPYKTILFSSLTSIARMIMRQALNLRGEGKGSVQTGGVLINTIEDYNAETSGIVQTIIDRCLYQLEAHFILEAHVVEVSYKDLKGSTHISRRLLTGGKQIAAELPAYFDEIYHFNVDRSDPTRSRYTALTRHVGDDFAKTSLGLPPVLDFTDQTGWSVIESYLKGEK